MSDDNPYEYSDPPGKDSYPDAVLLDDTGGRIEFRPEKFFGWWQIVGFGCLALPVGIVVVMMSGLSLIILPLSLFSQNEYSLIFGIVLLVPSLLMFFLMPWWGYPNCFVSWIISRFHELPVAEGHYLCQFATHPPRYGKLRVFLEDGDDLGVLELKDDHLLFEGDHTTAVIPYSCIESIGLKNTGFNKSLWLGYYLRIHLSQEVGQKFQYILIGDRAAKTLLGSYRTIREIRNRIEAKIK